MLVHVLYLGKQKIINVHYCFHFSKYLSVKFQNPQKSFNFNFMELTILIFLLNTLMVLRTEAINNGNVTYKK